MPSRGTCLLQHVNLGACTLDNLQEAFTTGMSELCDLHGRTGVGESGEYLTPDNDRQVGLGMLGLANFLRRYNITYEKFGEALRLVNLGYSANNEAGCAAWALNNAIFEAAQIARENNMNDGDTYMCIENDEQEQQVSLKSMVMQGKWAPVEYENDLLANIKNYYDDGLNTFTCEFIRPYVIEIPIGSGT